VGKAAALQGVAGEQTEPDLDLVEPRSVGGSEVEMDVGMALQPAVVFGFVGVEIVEDDVEGLVGRVRCDHAVEEIEKLDAPAPAPRPSSALSLMLGRDPNWAQLWP